jgi:hypothetical protein
MNQAAQPRVAASNIEASRVLANNATEYMYDAYIYVMEESCKKIACLLNKSVTYGAKKYRDLLKQEDVKDRNFVATVRMLPTELEIANLQAMMNNSIASNPQLIIYLDPFKAMRIAKENVPLAELYFRQAQKRYIKTEQEKAQSNSEQNAQIQQASMQAKSQGDAVLLEKTNFGKEKQIVLQGMFDLAKANIPVPVELQQLISDMLQNVEVPIAVQNQQRQQALEQQAQQEQQQMEQQQMEGQQGSPEEEQMMMEQQQMEQQ